MDLGKARIQPQQPITAGSFATLTYTYTTGHPIDDSGYLKIVFRYAGDFGKPQFSDPTASNYCHVITTGDCQIQPRWDQKGHTRPWGQSLILKISGGYLNKGDKIIVVFGDRSSGSPGWQMQSFCEDTLEFKTLVDPIASYQFKELRTSPTIKIVPGQAVEAICLAPSQAVVGQAFTYYLKLQDRWGNPIAKPQQLTCPGFAEEGIQRLMASDPKTGLSACSNPVEIVAEPKDIQAYWADFHGQTEETIGSNSIDQYFTFARDYGLLDISGHQGNDFQVTDSFWQTVNRTAKQFNEDGRFVTFPGYEWSGNTPLGGDRNVYFSNESGQIARSTCELLPGNKSCYPDAPTATELFQNLKRQEGSKSFVFAHVGGRYADMTMHDPDIEVATEIHSAWGTFEWLGHDALNLGYRIGFCANSDGHKCRPGASYPGASHFGSLGGLTCVKAAALTRDAVLEALYARHFYATTGNRSLLDVQLLLDGNPVGTMGDVVPVHKQDLQLNVEVAATAALESIELINGSTVIKSWSPWTSKDLGKRIKITWSGAEVRGRARKSCWDGFLYLDDNRITNVQAVNFWNPDRQPVIRSEDHVDWRSITTGGASGLILDLAETNEGVLYVETKACRFRKKISAIGLKPMVHDCGGLEKQIRLYRLPDTLETTEAKISWKIDELHAGDNPMYIRVTQVDGHIAWISPIYLVK